jgi:DNA uptake protein ComE-like DNA-binding protein
MDELIDKNVVKAERISQIQERGGVAAFIPVDLNQATRRDITDIVGLTKEQAKKVVDERPFASIEELLTRGIADKYMLARFVENGAVVGGGQKSLNKVELNKAEQESLLSLGLSAEDCQRLVRARPFETWVEVERFLGLETDAKSGIGATLRERACLFSGSS